MRLPQLLPALLPVAVFTIAACSNSNQTTNSSTDTTHVATMTTTNAASTVITSPQNMMVVLHKVSNYAKWKTAYDADDPARVAAGIHSYVIGRGLLDSNTVQVILKVDDTAKAMAFGKSPGLKAAMQKGGVMGTPKVSLTTVLFQDTAMLSSKLRSSVTLNVKDWDAWLKNFDEGKGERLDNGLAVRGYGHDAADNHKVSVVTALVDSAKAVAYFKSDALKKRMKTSGVTGAPDRFLYRIVQRY